MNLCRQALSKINFSYKSIYSNVAKCSTSHFLATSVEKVKEDEGELDKLYKTVELELRGNDPAVLRSYAKFSTTAAGHLDVEAQSWGARKPHHDRLTLLKSVHIYKKHRVQYEFRTYFHFIKFRHVTGSTADTLLEYLQRNLPEGVALKTTKVELQRLPDHLTPPNDQKMVE